MLDRKYQDMEANDQKIRLVVLADTACRKNIWKTMNLIRGECFLLDFSKHGLIHDSDGSHADLLANQRWTGTIYICVKDFTKKPVLGNDEISLICLMPMSKRKAMIFGTSTGKQRRCKSICRICKNSLIKHF